MENWQQKILDIASAAEEKFDTKKFELKKKLNWIEPVVIQPFRGFANDKKIILHGRVIEDEGLAKPEKGERLWENIKRVYYRYESDEIPFAKVDYEYKQYKGSTKCNAEGFFTIEINLNEPLQESDPWQQITLRLCNPPTKEQDQVEAKGDFLLDLPNSTFGVISDIDDTIVVSKATNFMDKARIMLLNNSQTRKPFEGVGAFYRALQKGPADKTFNPIFYVSSSSWNLYDLFERFCEVNNIPKGPFLLRELGIDKAKFIKSSHEEHKSEKIEETFKLYDLPFILIGDSGQKDPEIYHDLAKKYPHHIKCIYIRDVKPEISDQRDQEVKNIAKDLEQMGIPMILIENSLQAARHAIEHGFIKPESIAEIEKDTYQDKEKPADISQMLGLDKLSKIF